VKISLRASTSNLYSAFTDEGFKFGFAEKNDFPSAVTSKPGAKICPYGVTAKRDGFF
jgi:hypothetical protein